MPPREKPSRTELTKDEAKALLTEDDEIHTFRDASVMGAVVMFGADVPRDRLLALIDRWPCYRSGPMATGMGHGLCIQDKSDPLFVATREDETDGTKKRTR